MSGDVMSVQAEAVEVIVDHWKKVDPKWDPSWPTVAKHTLEALSDAGFEVVSEVFVSIAMSFKDENERLRKALVEIAHKTPESWIEDVARAALDGSPPTHLYTTDSYLHGAEPGPPCVVCGESRAAHNDEFREGA